MVNNRLYATEFIKFNDVYECAFYHNGLNNEILKYIYDKKLENKNKYICCFSQKNNKLNDNLMWAHYANGHCGMRIDFNVNLNDIKKVDYVEDFCYFDEHLGIQENLEKIMTTKLNMWEYEQEYRIISNNQYIDIDVKSITIGKGFYKNNIFKDEKENLKNLVYSLKAINPNVKIKVYESRYKDIEIEFN